MLYSGTDPESYITEYTLVYEEKDRPDFQVGQPCKALVDPGVWLLELRSVLSRSGNVQPVRVNLVARVKDQKGP